MCHITWPAYADHSPRPFQPAFGSSMRPSMPLGWNPMGYGTRSITTVPFGSRAFSESELLPRVSGTLSPSPPVLNWSTKV